MTLPPPGAVPRPTPVHRAEADGHTDPDAPVPWHYGDPVREQRALAAGRAVTDLSHRGLLIVSGADRLAWLHSLTTQHLTDLAPGTPTETLVLSPHGHVEHALHVVDDGERCWLSTEPGAAAAVLEFLRGMRFRRAVEVTDVSGDWAALGVVAAPDADGPLGRRAASSGSAPDWQDPWPALGPDTGSYTVGEVAGDAPAHPGWQRPWREVWLPRGEVTELLTGALSGRPGAPELAGSWAAEALRVAAWRPREGFENDHRTLPHECDWLRTALHLTKGCYRGQETVARVYHLGRPPRRLVMLHLDGSGADLPAPGAAVRVSGDDEARDAGHVTTAVRHHELGPVALALVKRTLPTEVELRVRLADGTEQAASQEIVVAP